MYKNKTIVIKGLEQDLIAANTTIGKLISSIESKCRSIAILEKAAVDYKGTKLFKIVKLLNTKLW
mgnify:CR=1 FL=1